MELLGRPVIPVNRPYLALSEFAGEWNAVQTVFMDPNSKPLVLKGTARQTMHLDGRLAILESEYQGQPAYKSMTFVTWNVTKQIYEGMFIDVHSVEGFDPLEGLSIADSIAMARAGAGSPICKRVWKGRITFPQMADAAPGAPRVQLGFHELPLRFVENQISNDEWIFQAFRKNDKGEEFLGMEIHFTRKR